MTIQRLLALLVAPSLLAVASCSGADKPELTPAQTLAAAKKNLDRARGVHLVLSTEKLPAGVSGIVRADGVGTHAPAFKGTITVSTGGITADAPVVAVDNVVYAKLPFTTSFVQIDPADYGAPDPADLMDPDQGLSSLLTAVRDPKEGKPVRSGEQVLTEISGTLPGSAVATVLPSATARGTFQATYTVDDANRLQQAVLTGPFYPGAGDVTYKVRFDQYGPAPRITAP